MSFENKLITLVNDEIDSSTDIIDTLSDLQANLTYTLARVILALKVEGVDYPPERVYLDIKRIYAEKTPNS